MRVFLLSDDPVLAHRADRELAAAMTSLGHDVDVETCPDLDLSRAAAFGHELAARWVDAPPDAVIAHGWLAGMAAQVGARAGEVPVVQRFSRLARGQDDPERARFEAALGRGAAMILASCSEQAELLAAIGVPRQKVLVVPLGVDTALFTDDGPSWPRNGRRRLVAADELVSEDAVGALVAALPALPTCELLVIGPADVPDLAVHPVARVLVDAAQRRHVADRLKFVGPVDDTELPGLLRSADVAVATGRDSDDAAFVLRAMSCGVPVVAYDAGAVSDAVADGVTGLLVPPLSTSRLGDAVRSLLGDGLARDSYGLSATDRARARFAWDVIAEATLRVIEDVRAAPRWEDAAAS